MGSSPRSVRTEREVPNTSYTNGSGSTDECNLSFTTRLMKPTAATSKLKAGEILRVALGANDSVSTFNNSGDFCGLIAETVWEKKIIECLKKQHDYQAQVLRKIGESCEVKVYGV